MHGIGYMAQRSKPLSVAALALFAVLSGYASFHHHPVEHREGTCGFEQSCAHNAGEVCASQTDCNLCYYAATPKLVHAPAITGMETFAAVVSGYSSVHAPCMCDDYKQPRRGPPAFSHS